MGERTCGLNPTYLISSKNQTLSFEFKWHQECYDIIFKCSEFNPNLHDKELGKSYSQKKSQPIKVHLDMT